MATSSASTWARGVADITAASHWQGVQRLMAGGGRYLAVSRSGAGQMFAVVRMEDKTSAVRWCIPVGWRYRLYADKNPCGGSYKDLVGNGAVQTLSNLGDIGFNDKVSCSKWLQQ